MLAFKQNTVQKTRIVTVKLLVFSLGELCLSLRLEGIQKVMKMPQIFKSGDKCLGITQVGNQDVMVLDLYRQVYGTPAPQTKGHLIVLRAGENTFGLAVDTVPSMVEVPIAELCPLSEEFRDRDSLGIAEAMVKISLNKQQMAMAFVLDSGRLLELAHNLSSNL
jgi:chemotaxis signal transduction protein